MATTGGVGQRLQSLAKTAQRATISIHAGASVKSAVAAANNAFESVQKATKQAAEVADANFQAMSSTAVRATKAKRAA